MNDYEIIDYEKFSSSVNDLYIGSLKKKEKEKNYVYSADTVYSASDEFTFALLYVACFLLNGISIEKQMFASWC